MEEYNNKVQVISLDEDSAEFSAKSTFDHPYPTTKIMWIPDAVSNIFVMYFLFYYCFLHRKEFSLTFLQPVVIIYVFGKQENLIPGWNAF